MPKPTLGKGLGALIKPPASPAQPPAGDIVQHVPLDQIVPTSLQPRTHFPEENLEELTASIKEHGIIQPLIVRKQNDKLELIAGERRWRASKNLGLATVPTITREATDQEVLEMILIENLQRQDLNPIEEASGYIRLINEFGLKQEQISLRVGKHRASIANTIRLLDLPPDLQSLVSSTKLTVGHAKVILSIKDPQAQRSIAEQVLHKKLTVRATEKLTRTFSQHHAPNAKGKAPSTPSEIPATIRHLEKQLRARYATHATISTGAKKGQIALEYYGNEDLQRILDLMGLPPESI